jgi:hypothetical protein
MSTTYEVLVGNLGSVYSGDNDLTARTTFNDYRGQSAKGLGRVAGEDVTIMKNGEPHREYVGKIARGAAREES